MAWPFKRKLPDEEYIDLFRKVLMGTEAVTANHTPPSQSKDSDSVVAAKKEIRKVLPERDSYRPIHHALCEVEGNLSMQAEHRRRAAVILDEFGRTGESGKQSEYLKLSKRADRCLFLELAWLTQCRKLANALPELDPLRLIFAEIEKMAEPKASE